MDDKALGLVERLNQELFDRLGEDAATDFFFITNGNVSAILFGDHCVWDSESYSRYDDNGNEIPIESHVRAEMRELAKTVDCVAFPKCCALDCTGEGGANACVEALAPKGA